MFQGSVFSFCREHAAVIKYHQRAASLWGGNRTTPQLSQTTLCLVTGGYLPDGVAVHGWLRLIARQEPELQNGDRRAGISWFAGYHRSGVRTPCSKLTLAKGVFLARWISLKWQTKTAHALATDLGVNCAVRSLACQAATVLDGIKPRFTVFWSPCPMSPAS